MEDCTLYVTLESCQMCVGAIVQARILKAVIVNVNAKTGCADFAINILQMEQFNHQVGVPKVVLADECKAMTQDFFRLRESKG